MVPHGDHQAEDQQGRDARRPGKALGPSTKRRAIVTVKSVISHAVTLKWFSHHPSAHIQAPKQEVAVAEGEIWTAEWMITFLDFVADHRRIGCFALTLLGLRRDVVDAPKNLANVRDLPIPTARTDHAQGHADDPTSGSGRQSDDRSPRRTSSFPGSTEPRSPFAATRRLFTDRRKAVKLPPITLRNLRHSSDSVCVRPESLRTWWPPGMGHSERITQAVYAA